MHKLYKKSFEITVLAEAEIEAVCIAKSDEDQKTNIFEGETIKLRVYFQSRISG